MKPLLELDQITCHYRGHTAVHKLSLHVNQGDLFCLLGPSGCGKTTVLRAIAGFETVHSGQISLRGKNISTAHYTLPPEKRRIGMVFQDYALFPHMNVHSNVSFGLQDKRPTERNRIAHEMLETVEIGRASCRERV